MGDRTPFPRGGRSRNKVAVGEPAAGSPHIFTPPLIGWEGFTKTRNLPFYRCSSPLGPEGNEVPRAHLAETYKYVSAKLGLNEASTR